MARRLQEGTIMTPHDYIAAARVPKAVQPKTFGPWSIERIPAGGQIINPRQKAMHEALVGFPDYTLLRHYTLACEMGAPAEIVMEDSVVELSKHLPIWITARGSVLVTGLGLGCVVRGLLANSRVEHITVVEKCPYILGEIGPEFWNDPRVAVRLEDALQYRPERKFDFAWHDLHSFDERHLQSMHAELIVRHSRSCKYQGAWGFPRFLSKLMQRKNYSLIGVPR
jgi:hypothetical protein